MGKERFFRFREFGVNHSRSAMKVGEDAVLLGAWVQPPQPARLILDAGTGCGLIALMCAQRFGTPYIIGVDLDTPSVAEAAYNFAVSPWADRLQSRPIDFMALTPDALPGKADLIISNPPYFTAGVVPGFWGARMRARHVAVFGPDTLLSHGVTLLSPEGVIALVCPAQCFLSLAQTAEDAGLVLRRKCDVYGSPKAAPKRLMLEFGRVPVSASEVTSLYVRAEDGSYTDAYRKLTAPFYLRGEEYDAGTARNS